MKIQAPQQADQLQRLACFLEEHPGFSPALSGEDALVCGFRIGECFLTIAEMNKLIATQPEFNADAASLLLAFSEAAWRVR